ncbi:hypothetical protein V4U86_15485 [Mycobacterium sp. AMU20-3851]|uniref:hypothetical protein n=1 Tax=Mycobacterium sp. AMU20-3851 TaxID=3122055 RepID=UPI0037542BB1
MSVLVRVGLVELAFGALLGWAMVGNLAAPQLMTRIGIISPRRILQAHLDYVMMGLILIAVGLALPALASWIAVLVIGGTLLNPTLFLPLAFNERLAKTRGFQGVSAVSFLATSVGLVAAACSSL